MNMNKQSAGTNCLAAMSPPSSSGVIQPKAADSAPTPSAARPTQPPSSASAKSSNPRNRGDPRMKRACLARIANPTLTLLAALKIGGFTFPQDHPTCEDKDDDGVRLRQRKNQLSRRIRREKRANDDDDGGDGEDDESAANDSQKKGAKKRKKSSASASASSKKAKKAKKSKTNKTKASPSSSGKKKKKARTSKGSSSANEDDDDDDRSREEEAAAELLQLAGGGSPRGGSSGNDAGSDDAKNEGNNEALPGSIDINVPTASTAAGAGTGGGMGTATAVPPIISQHQLEQLRQAQVLQLQQKLQQEAAAAQQLQISQIQGLQGLDALTLQQLAQGSALNGASLAGNTNANAQSNLLTALLSNQQHQQQAFAQPQLQQQVSLDALLLQEVQRQQVAHMQQLHALQNPAAIGGQLVPNQLQQLQLQLQLAQAQQAKAQAQAQAQQAVQSNNLQAQNLLGSLLGGTVASPPTQPPPPATAIASGPAAPNLAGVDVSSLAAALNTNTGGAGSQTTAQVFEWMKQSAPEAFQKLCQDAGLNPAAAPASPSTAKV